MRQAAGRYVGCKRRHWRPKNVLPLSSQTLSIVGNVDFSDDESDYLLRLAVENRKKVVEDVSSVVAAVAERESRPGNVENGRWKRVLAEAWRSGQLTDSAYKLLLEIVVSGGGGCCCESPSAVSLMAAGTNRNGDLDELIDETGDENEDCGCEQLSGFQRCRSGTVKSQQNSTACSLNAAGKVTFPWDSELIYREEAIKRDWCFKRGALTESQVYGLTAGLHSRLPPFEPLPSNTASHASAHLHRQLRPLKVAADASMPGFVEHFLSNKCQHFKATSTNMGRRNQTTPKGVPAAGGELYRRLARALDQRAPPGDRLFTKHQNRRQKPVQRYGWKEQRNFENSQPLWMRGSVSRHLFGHGTNLFPPRCHTTLAAYDPDNQSR